MTRSAYCRSLQVGVRAGGVGSSVEQAVEDVHGVPTVVCQRRLAQVEPVRQAMVVAVVRAPAAAAVVVVMLGLVLADIAATAAGGAAVVLLLLLGGGRHLRQRRGGASHGVAGSPIAQLPDRWAAYVHTMVALR